MLLYCRIKVNHNRGKPHLCSKYMTPSLKGGYCCWEITRTQEPVRLQAMCPPTVRIASVRVGSIPEKSFQSVYSQIRVENTYASWFKAEKLASGSSLEGGTARKHSQTMFHIKNSAKLQGKALHNLSTAFLPSNNITIIQQNLVSFHIASSSIHIHPFSGPRYNNGILYLQPPWLLS